MSRWRVGTAGWSIAGALSDSLPASGSQLDRYSQRLNAVEINSSFNRSHRRQTYERWAGSVPDGFRFSVKLPRTITHERRLVDCQACSSSFWETGGLGAKLPSCSSSCRRASPSTRAGRTFFATMREMTGLGIAFEPRHASWFDGEADALLQASPWRASRRPAAAGGRRAPAGWPGLAYFRLHGSPRIYCSDYEAAALAGFERQLHEFAAAGAEVWCIFDNTAASHALGNALAVTDAAARSE